MAGATVVNAVIALVAGVAIDAVRKAGVMACAIGVAGAGNLGIAGVIACAIVGRSKLSINSAGVEIILPIATSVTSPISIVKSLACCLRTLIIEDNPFEISSILFCSCSVAIFSCFCFCFFFLYVFH